MDYNFLFYYSSTTPSFRFLELQLCIYCVMNSFYGHVSYTYCIIYILRVVVLCQLCILNIIWTVSMHHKKLWTVRIATRVSQLLTEMKWSSHGPFYIELQFILENVGSYLHSD